MDKFIKVFLVTFGSSVIIGITIGAAVALNHPHEHATLVGLLIGVASGIGAGAIVGGLVALEEAS